MLPYSFSTRDTPRLGCAGKGARFAARLSGIRVFLPRSGLVQQFIQPDAASRHGLIQALERMTPQAQQLEKAARLAAVTQKVGFALWQLQELEDIAAQYFVLLVQAKKGMGLAEGNALVEKAQAKTFGATLHQIAKAGLISPEMEERFAKLLAERNWLVHRSRAESRSAIHAGEAMTILVDRLEAMADEALALLKYIGVETSSFGQQHGVSMQHVEKISKQLLAQWHAVDAL